ncbi:S1 family peptidase [Streptomyces djakartensis]|nr:S1 family peptidase [Streptomyces djakartensis]
MAMAISVLPSAWTVSAAHAVPAPLTDPAQADALTAELGPNRTAGVYRQDGRLVFAVTDQAAAASVREAGGTAKVVAHSTAALTSAQNDLDELAGIPNTSWGANPSSNQVVVKIYDGVSAADRERINEVAAAHGDAVRVERHSGRIEQTAYEMRGGLGIESSQGTLCSAAFSVTPNDGDLSTGQRYLLTAGHCVVGGNTTWHRWSGGISLGSVTDWSYEPGDWAVIKYTNPDVAADGMVQYKDGTASQITGSRWVVDNEKVKRVGTMSQDLDGMVLNPSVTVNYDTGATLHNMIESSLCNVRGDSGGAMFTGTTALGITSGGNYVDEPCGDTDSQADRSSFYHPVQQVLITHDLAAY